MNEEALQYGYNLFKNDGYNGTFEEYKALISSNKEALDYSYTLFKNDGYTDSIDDFENLFGLKKKEDTESASLDGSLESRPISELEFDGDTEFQKKFKSTGLNTLSNLARIPAFIQEQVITAFGSEEDKKLLNDMPFEQRETALAAISVPGNVSDGWREASESLRQKAQEIEGTIEQYDQSITEDIGDLQLGRAAYRLFNEVGGAIPSIMQAMVPVVGLASMGVSTAAGKSRELQEEGEGLSLKTSATAALYGTAEAALETVTRGIGKKFFKSLSGQTDEYIKNSIKEFGKQTAKDFAKEGASELGTEILQNMTDYAIQGDEDAFKKELSHYSDIFIIGGFATTPLSAGGQGVGLARQVAQKRELGRKLESSKYTDLTSTFVDPTIDTDTEMVAEPQNKKFLKFDLDQKVEKGELTQVEADQAIKNFENTIYVKNELKGLEIPAVHRTNIANLILEKRDLKAKVEGKDPVLVAKDKERLAQIDEEIKNFIETEQELQEAAAVVEPVVETPTETPVSEKLSDIINRPVTVNELGGAKLDTPIVGDLYIDGQQVVVEDANGNLTEIGNVEELGDTPIDQLGIEYKTAQVNANPDGTLSIGDKIYSIQEDLPTQGLVFDEEGNVLDASVKDETGKPVMFKGSLAEDIAYQVLLKKATSPEQAETINQLLEQDDEFRKATAATQVTTDQDTEQVAGTDEALEQPVTSEQQEVKPKKSLDQEADEFLDSIGQKPLFQKEAAPVDNSEVDRITEEMNELSDERAKFDVPSDLTTKAKIKIKSLTDRFGDKVKVIKDISEFNNIPFIFTISDQLTSGDWTNPATGNSLKFFGGIGFNMTNETSAWANVNESSSKTTIKTAKDIYSKNKELFDRLWSEGKLPNGHIPMAVVKMGQNSIESNEAIFRVVSDNIKSNFSLVERTSAKNNLLKQLNERKANSRVVELASKYNTIDEVLDNINQIPLGLRSEVGSLLFYGSPNMGAPTKPGVPNSPVLKSLLDGKDNSLRALFHLPTINNQVREESTKDIPDGHIISIVGVDVINPAVTSVAKGDFQHQNYDYGVKGQLIGVLEKPVHAADVFPEMYSKSVYTFKENKQGKLPSSKTAVDQAVASSGAVAVIKAFRGAKVSTKMTALDIVLGKLRQAFPSVTVVNTQAEFDAVVNSPEVSKYSRDGDIIYGFTKDGKVFLNPRIANTNTAIHEYGHVWMNFVEQNNPLLLQKGYDLLEGTEILKEKVKIHGDNKIARMEALADLIGNKGESILNAGQKSKFKNWLNAMYTYIKSKFKAFSDMNADEFQNMSLNQFVDGVLSDLLSSREITDKAIKSIETTFQKVNADEIIERGIENGFSKEAIKLGLEKIGVDTFNFKELYSKAKAKYDSNVDSPKTMEVDDLYERSNKAIQDKIKKKGLAFYRDTTRELLLDRQARIKRLLKGVGSKEAQRALNLLITKSGGSGYANFRFKKADEKIFKGLSKEEVATLDKIIYARRIDAINTNRRQRGMDSYVGVEGYGQETAKRNLNEIKESIGEEKFRDLNSRATEYFNVFDKSLDRMREANLISEEVYTQLKETEYSPIKTIKYLIPEDYDAAEVDRMAEITGMNSALIKSLSDENVNEVIMDSRWLLQTNLSMVEARVFENRMLNSFYDAVQGATNEEAKAIEEFVLPNPEVGKTKEGKPIYKYDKFKVPVGFVKVGFLSNGNKVNMVIQEAYAKQLLDVKKSQGFLDNAIPKLTGTNILRFFATSGNPLFIVGNTAVDFANILFLSDVYSKNKFTGGARLAFDSVSTFLSKIAGSTEYNKVYQEYMEHGGSMDYLSSDGLRALESIKSKGALLDTSKKAMQAWGRVMSYLGESSEISFRLAVFQKSKENQLKDFKKTNKRDPDADEMQDIMFEAAREARETIDFAQGGSLVKSADKALPYLNAATQGFRKASDYATENPVGFATSMTQAMIMSGSFAAMSIFLLLRGIGDEDEEKITDILNSVSDYEKANYHVIFTGRKDADGEYEYVRIKKLPTISVFATIAENMVLKAALESRGIKYDFNEDLLIKNVESSVPIVPTPKNLISRNPLLSAAVTYQFNYDMFYDQEVFKAPRDKKIKASAEGVYDNRVNQVYKDLAKLTGVSPKRAQAALEKIITSESTNPMIGLIYSGYDGVKAPFTKGVGLKDEIGNVIDRTLESTSKKLVRKTNKDLIRYKQEADVDAERIKYDTEKYLSEQKMYSEIKKRYKEEKGEMTVGEFTDLIKENFDPKDQKKYTKKYLAYIKNINSDPAILDIIYEDTPEIQAMMLFNKYGDALEQEEINSILQVYKASGRKISKDGINIYQQKYQKK